MAVKNMSDYLPTLTADYNYTLNIAPHLIMPEEGRKKQIIYEYDDGSITVATLSNIAQFDIILQWNWLTYTDAGTIKDLWHNTSKANGSENTFYFYHPIDAKEYVVRFLEGLTTVHNTNKPNAEEVQQIKLRVHGVKA